jgi:hypothetical protein
MRKRDVILIIFLLALTVCLSGCLLAAVGAGAAGTVAYVKGDLEVVRPEGITDVYEATRKAVEQLEYATTESRKDATSALVVARDSQDDKITIKLKATPEGPTEISIRVGTWGSETRSSIIYDKIKDNLEP